MSLTDYVGPISDEPIRQTTEVLQVAGGRKFTLEIFEPPDAMLHPGVIVLHGADGAVRKAEEYREVCRALVMAGMVALRPHYFEAGTPAAAGEESLDSPMEHTAWLQAVNRTREYAASLPAIMESPLGLLGFSLGSYVALAAAAMHPRYGALVEFFGGFPPTLAPALRTMPPTLALHGENDPVVPINEAYRLKQIYDDHNLPIELHVYPGEGHNFSWTARQDAIARSAAFLQKHLIRKN